MIGKRTKLELARRAKDHPDKPNPDGISPTTPSVLERFEQLNQVGIALSKETDTTRLLESILETAKRITNADGGTIYRTSDDDSLRFEILHTDSLGLQMGGTT